MGSEPISLREIIRILTNAQDRADSVNATILLQVRLPRVLLTGLVGGILAVCGVVFQALLQNPLADPFTLGVSSGAALGAYLAMLLGFQSTVLGFTAMPLMAFPGGLMAVWLVYMIAESGRLQLPVAGLSLMRSCPP